MYIIYVYVRVTVSVCVRLCVWMLHEILLQLVLLLVCTFRCCMNFCCSFSGRWFIVKREKNAKLGEVVDCRSRRLFFHLFWHLLCLCAVNY